MGLIPYQYHSLSVDGGVDGILTIDRETYNTSKYIVGAAIVIQSSTMAPVYLTIDSIISPNELLVRYDCSGFLVSDSASIIQLQQLI